jgi:hypothetical protein
MPQSSRIPHVFLARREEIGVTLLLLLAILAFAFQYGTLEKFASIPPGTGLATLQEWASFIRGRIGLSWHDALIPIAMVVVVVSVVSLEIRGRTAAA